MTGSATKTEIETTKHSAKTNASGRPNAPGIIAAASRSAKQTTAASRRSWGVTFMLPQSYAQKHLLKHSCSRQSSIRHQLAPSRNPAVRSIITMSEQTMTDQEFRNRADSALETLRKRLQQLGDEYNFEVEGESGRLDLCFEEPEETRFVISPNAPVRQIWISALTTSFKLGWSDAAQTFALVNSGETLAQVMSRILSQQLGSKVTV
jgi:iron donor protein CyaY